MSSGEHSPTSRPDLYVLARIIERLKEHGPINRTTLATSTGIAYDGWANTSSGCLKEVLQS